jgi:ABC-type phosphate transport system substrate-binding protein
MTNLTSKLGGGMAAAVALATAFSANATITPLYSGGGTLAEKVYRDIYNQYGANASGDLCAGLPSTYCATTPYNSIVEILYTGVGSGNGKSAIDNYAPANLTAGPRTPDNPPVPSGRDFGAFYGTGEGTSWVPGTTPAYPKITFVGSDDPLNATDVATYNGLATTFGPLIQFPDMVTPVTLPFTPTAYWNPKGKLLTGGSSMVNLSTNAVCGIWTGAITNWNSSVIAAANGTTKATLGSGLITPVYRHDGSGTTFIFSNGLLNQCGSSKFPVATYPVPEQWLIDTKATDKNGNVVTATSDAGPPYLSTDTLFIDVFDAKHLPSNFYNDNGGFSGQTGGCKGSGGVQLCVDNTIGGIGYLSPDFVQPVIVKGTLDSKGNPVAATANIQTYYSFHNNTTAIYEAPTSKAAGLVMASAPVPTGTAFNNPIAWGAVNPTPTTAAAYPFAGFTFIDMYSCYASQTTVTSLVGTTAGSLGLWYWFFGTPAQNNSVITNTMTANGFSTVPTAWTAAIKKLLVTDTTTKVGIPGKAGTACATVTHGA